MSPELQVAIVGALGAVLAAVVAALPSWFNRQADDDHPVKARRGSKRPRRTTALVVLGVLLVISAIIFYGSRVASRFATSRDAALTWPRLVKHARDEHVPYVMPNVTIFATLERVARDPTHRRLRIRTIYSLQPLRNIDRSEVVFGEFYTFVPDTQQKRWYGSNEELSKSPSTFDVRFQGVAGWPVTIVTGVNAVVTPQQLGASLRSSLGLSSDTSIIEYSNGELGSGGDYIGQLLLIVDSPDCVIEPLFKGAIRREKSGQVTLNDEFSGAPDSAGLGQRSISARWTNLAPGESVAIALRSN